jgi:putative hemolysin
MQPFPWIDLAIIIALVLLNGVFAASELAIVSARRARLEAMVRARRRGAASALRLAADPGKLLSTVQIGITLIAVISGAYSGASLGGPVTDRLRWLGMSAGIAETLAIVMVIGLTTFLSLVIGELVPKRLALRRPEPIAVVVAAPMIWLSRAAAPLVWLLDGASGALFWLLRLPGHAEDHVTAEELQLIVAEASKSGVIEEHERTIISGVVRLADRPVREVMTPRTDVEWLDADLDEAGVRHALMASGHSRLPVAEGSVDAVIGVVQARDVAQALFRGEALNLRALMRPAPVVLDQIDAMDALDTMRAAEVPMALIHDEYGHFEGIVTPANLLAAIAGEFASDADPDDAPAIVEREDGSLLVAGQTAADLLAERLGINLPEDRDYATVAGLALAVFRHLPGEGESFTLQGWRFEVVDLDGRRIDKLLVSAS